MHTPHGVHLFEGGGLACQVPGVGRLCAARPLFMLTTPQPVALAPGRRGWCCQLCQLSALSWGMVVPGGSSPPASTTCVPGGGT